MIWLWTYLAIGAIALVVLLVVSRIKQGVKTDSMLMASLRGPLSRREFIIEKVLGPVLAGIFMVVAWPVGIWLVFDEELKFKRDEKRMKKAEFKVRRSDLLGKTSPEEVAAAEMVLDPMGAVPSLPFGHLNKAWETFLTTNPSGAELWSFACDWESYWGVKYRRAGYVWVRNRKPASWFLTLNERLEND